MSYLFVFLFGIVAWRRPVLGYALFMLLQTPLSNVAGALANPQLGSVVLILATIKLLVRKPQQSGSKRLRSLELYALALSLVVLVRQAGFLSFGFAPGQYVSVLLLAFLWGPLLMAFNRLDEGEMASLRLWMAVAGIVVGVWGSLIFLTGSEYLTRMAIWGNPDAIGVSIPSSVDQLVTSRFIVMGLYTVVPSAYWYVLRGALAQTRKRWLMNLAMYGGVGAILIAVGLSGTRSMILLLGIGTVVMLVALVLIRGWNWRSRARTFVIGAIAVCLLGVAVSHIDFTVMVERFQVRFSMLNLQDQTVEGRLEDTANAWAYIKQHHSLFGAPGPLPLESYERTGDPALPMILWFYYGLPGLVLAGILFLTAFGTLFKRWLAQRLSPEQRLLRSMLTAWALTYVFIWIAGSYLFPPEVFFMVLFFSEIDRLKRKRLITPNSEPRRTAA